VTALITLDAEAMAAWAKESGMPQRPYVDRVSSAEARVLVKGYIDQLNAQLNHWEQIKKFIILDKDLSIEDGDLTPSLQLKRKVVANKHMDELDTLYSGAPGRKPHDNHGTGPAGATGSSA